MGRRLNAHGSPYVVLDSLPTGGSPTDPRTQLATLAYYYLLADPNRTFLMSCKPAADVQRSFAGAWVGECARRSSSPWHASSSSPWAVHDRRRRHRGGRDEGGTGDDLTPSART